MRSQSPIVPCLWFDDQAEAAAGFYTRTFPDGRITATSRYPESFDNPGGRPRGSSTSRRWRRLSAARDLRARAGRPRS